MRTESRALVSQRALFLVARASIIGSLGPPPNIELQVYAFITILMISGTFVGLLGWNLFELHIVKYLVRRWRLKERCGISARTKDWTKPFLQGKTAQKANQLTIFLKQFLCFNQSCLQKRLSF